MVCESIDRGNDVTCHTVPLVLFLVFLKMILLLNMDKEEPNFNIWGAAKVEQIYKKQQEKRCFAQLEKDDWQQLVASAEAKSTQKNTK